MTVKLSHQAGGHPSHEQSSQKGQKHTSRALSQQRFHPLNFGSGTAWIGQRAGGAISYACNIQFFFGRSPDRLRNAGVPAGEFNNRILSSMFSQFTLASLAQHCRLELVCSRVSQGRLHITLPHKLDGKRQKLDEKRHTHDGKRCTTTVDTRQTNNAKETSTRRTIETQRW